MIENIRRRISVILVVMLGIVWIGIILIFDWNSYRRALTELRFDLREDIREIGWTEFLEQRGQAEELADAEYCLIVRQKDGQVSILINQLPDVPEERLLEYGRRIYKSRNMVTSISGYTYFTTSNHMYGRIIVLISSRRALEEVAGQWAASALAGAAGLLLFVLAARRMAQMLVRPLEESLENEKKFISDSSHELKTPLTVIHTNAELLLEEVGENRHLRYIMLETDRMIELTARMSALMRLDSNGFQMQMRRFDFGEAMQEVIFPMESVAYEKGKMLELQIEEKLFLTGNEEQLKSVMSILLDNAISYSPRHGKIAIRIRAAGKKICLSVSSEGEAIPEKERKRLFERFYRADEARTGKTDETHFGLGLPIAAGIVSRHNGKITVDYRDGMNVFEICLPRR